MRFPYGLVRSASRFWRRDLISSCTPAVEPKQGSPSPSSRFLVRAEMLSEIFPVVTDPGSPLTTPPGTSSDFWCDCGWTGADAEGERAGGSCR